MNDKSKAILEKVKKLLALANNAGATESERDNALRMAHGLLAKHNLDMIDLEQSQTMEDRIKHEQVAYAMIWAKTVYNSVAKLFFCKCYVSTKINSYLSTYQFVGKTSNATTAGLIAEYVANSIIAECKVRYGTTTSREGNSFCKGAANRIYWRIDDMIKEAKPEGAESTALVVQNLYKSELEANELFIKQSGVVIEVARTRNTSSSANAYHSGSAYGDKINLNTQLANRNQLKLN